MFRFRFLRHFLRIFAIVAILQTSVFCDENIDESSLKAKYQAQILYGHDLVVSDNIFKILLPLIVVILMFIVFFYIQIKRKNELFFNQKGGISRQNYETKIAVNPAMNKPVKGDLVREIGYYFPVLYKLAQKNDNTVLFEYDTKYERFFIADFESFLYLLHGISEFFVLLVEHSTIKIKFSKLQDSGEKMVKFNVAVIAYGNFIEHSTMIRNAIAQNSHNVFYEKLKLTCRYADALGVKINYFCSAESSEIMFDVALKPYKNLLENASYNAKMEVLISDANQISAELLKEQLINLGINNISVYDDISDINTHIKSVNYVPDIIFVCAKQFGDDKLKYIQHIVERKNTTIVITSNNEGTLVVAENLNFKSHILRQPYTIDTLVSILCEVDRGSARSQNQQVGQILGI